MKVSELKYAGGGYFREKNVPAGTKAEIVHGPEMLEMALQEIEEHKAVATKLYRLVKGQFTTQKEVTEALEEYRKLFSKTI
jgi:hypothetical protein